MILIFETTSGQLVPAGVAPSLPRGGLETVLIQFATAGVAALLADGTPVALNLYSPSDLATPLVTLSVFTALAADKAYKGALDTVSGGLAWLERGTLIGKVSYGTPNVDSAAFLVNYGVGASAVGAPPVQLVIRESTGGGSGGGVGALTQLVGTFGGSAKLNQLEGNLVVQGDAEIPSVLLSAQDAPTGADLQVELYKNGAATGKIGVLTAATKRQETVFGSVLAVIEGDLLQFAPIQIGSGKAGTNLVVQVTMRGV